jgi:hypothetical protein
MSSDSEEEETVKYGELEYWEERYGSWAKSPYDWLFEWKHVRHIVKAFIKKSELVYLPGCGNAPFSADMYKDGWENQINIDNSVEAIKKMLELHSEECPKAEWLIKDSTELEYPDEHFGAVIDKSLIDTTVCSTDGVGLTKRFVHETHRVLKTGGLYITMSLHTWEEIEVYFKCETNYKFASAAIMVNNPDFNNDMPSGKKGDAPSLKCFAIAKKLANDASREDVENETKRLKGALQEFDDTWMDPEQVAEKKNAVEDETQENQETIFAAGDDAEADGNDSDDEATVEDLTKCLRRIHVAQVRYSLAQIANCTSSDSPHSLSQKNGYVTSTEHGQIKDMLLSESTKCTVAAILQVIDEKEKGT